MNGFVRKSASLHHLLFATMGRMTAKQKDSRAMLVNLFVFFLFHAKLTSTKMTVRRYAYE